MEKAKDPLTECSIAFVSVMWKGKKWKLNLLSSHKPHTAWLPMKVPRTGWFPYCERKHFPTSLEMYFNLPQPRPQKHECALCYSGGPLHFMAVTALWQMALLWCAKPPGGEGRKVCWLWSGRSPLWMISWPSVEMLHVVIKAQNPHTANPREKNRNFPRKFSLVLPSGSVSKST